VKSGLYLVPLFQAMHCVHAPGSKAKAGGGTLRVLIKVTSATVAPPDANFERQCLKYRFMGAHKLILGLGFQHDQRKALFIEQEGNR
jgi:hypothetical protein